MSDQLLLGVHRASIAFLEAVRRAVGASQLAQFANVAYLEDRWLSVAKANLRGRGLPPVELIQVGEVYFVRDGHHRISVAAALGQQEIDAVVTVWQVTVPAQAQRADVERPQPHQSRAFLLRLARGSTAEV